MLILLTIVAFGVLAALVTWRRRATARWQPDPARSVGERGVPWCAKVWVQTLPPRRSMRAGERVTGELCVDTTARVATFRVPDGQQVQLTNARAVSVGARGTDFVNSWVEVDCDVDGRRMTIYLNDATWLGWRALFTMSNARLADAMQTLLAQGGTAR